jgi:hypothetical protein
VDNGRLLRFIRKKAERMNGTPSPAFTVADLQRLLTRVEPAALLVPPRILRRVIKRDRDLSGPGLQVSHHKSYVLDRDRLLGIADRDELGVDPARELPPTLLLFPRPDSPRDREAMLLKYWRLLFHARVHLALQARSASDGQVQDRIRRIGLTEFDEATAVLRQDHFLLPPGDARTVYEEFAAVYLELRYFAPHLLPVYFPACARFETIDATLALDVDAAALFAATRLEGAPDPAPAPAISPPLEDELDQPPARSASDGRFDPSLALRAGDMPRAYRRLLNRADRASARGNVVRAAIFRMRAVPLAPSGQVNPTRAAARHEIERFSTRLQKALGYADAVAGDWRLALLALLEPAAQGIWPVESRMLYDLQKACIDQERPVYAVDLVEWFVTWGRRPIKRLLPFHDSVRTVKHLRSAMHRLTAIRIAKPIRLRLLALLIESTHQGEHRLRERLRPVLRDALDKVGLTPRNIAEQTAGEKVVEELIDRIVEHGFFGMGDLRDAIARNRLKLPDLTGNDEPTRSVSEGGPRLRFGLVKMARGIKTFFLGDPLIRANRQLAAALDGVYHRGEIYLRWLQRFSAAAFGTHIGRLLTLYVALPFGCSIALLKMWDEVTERIVGGPPEGSEAAKEAAKHINPYAFTLLGLFFLALFHVAPFRRGLLRACVKLWRALGWLFGDLPARLLRSPWMVRLLQSRTWLFCYQFLLKPLPWAVLSALGLIYLGLNLPLSLGTGAAVFAAAAFLLNSRLGRYVEEAWTDRLVRTWQLIHSDLVPGLVRWVIYLFRRLQEEVERIIYTADEWLRFRPGDSRLSLVVKPALGLLWFCFTYVFRVIFNLFVEPTINPIKHFPVVTVTAKLILPITGQLLEFFRTPIEPVLGKALGNTVALTAIGLLPGLGGFLVWEFKENWRLYRANQSPTLQPEIVGHHGETVLRLMRPGLHSGTLPKLYARLRHVKGRSARKKHEILHHLGARLRQFVERDLLAVLAGSQSWGRSTPLTPREIAIATNRIRLELAGPGASVHVDFEEHAGYLVAGLTSPAAWPETWLARLTGEQEAAFRDALGGFYKLAGVEVVREQVAALLPAEAVYDLRTEGLVVWPASEENGEFIYPLDEGGELLPRPRDSASFSVLPPLAADALLYSATPIRWADWVQTWQLDHDGKGHAPLLPPRVRLLPALR